MPDSTLHIYAPPPDERHCQVNYCPTCDRTRRMFTTFHAWLGSTVTCAGCGEQWQDGCRTERPFYQHWRRDMRRYVIQQLARIGVKA